MGHGQLRGEGTGKAGWLLMFDYVKPEQFDYVKPETPPGGAELLDEVRNAVTRYCVLPSEHAVVAVVLWIATTYFVRVFEHAPRLAITSPEKRCGKSRLLEVVRALCHQPLVSVNATIAAIFRSIDPDDPPTLIVDEADAIFGTKQAADQHEDFRSLLNAGHSTGWPMRRCIGPLQTPTDFSTFAMAAIAAIGKLPDTITDRAVNITMRRRAPAETVSPYRKRRDEQDLLDLARQLATWADGCRDDAAKRYPELPVEDRAADTWEPLVVVADMAGGRWPALARAACRALAAEHDAAEHDASLGVALLDDVQKVFREEGVAELASAALVQRLREIEESPWAAFDLTVSGLAHKLKPYKIKPVQVRPDGGKQVRGYRLADLSDAFARYLPDPPSQAVTPSQSQVKPVTPDELVTGQGVTTAQGVTGMTSENDTVTTCDTHPTEDATTKRALRLLHDELGATPLPPTGTEKP